MAVAFGATALLLACDSTLPLPAPVLPIGSCDPLTAPAVVTFAWDARPDTMRIIINSAETVAAACQYIETQSGPNIPSGPIVKGAGIADTRVPFHFIADSVRLVDVGIEICDGALMKTAAEVNEYFQGATGNANSPKAPFCPWNARPVRVE